MRVLLVSQEVPPETGWGGIGTYIGLLAPALAAAGAEVHVLSVVRGQESSTVERDGVTIHRRPLPGPHGLGRATRLVETWSRLSIARGVAVAFGKLDIEVDVVEAPDWNAEGLRLRRRRRLPLVVRMHSGGREVFPYLGRVGLDERLAIAIERAQIRRATVVTGTRAQLTSAGAAGAVTAAITCPVAVREVRPLADHLPTICFVGRFEPRKNPGVLVEALPAILRAVPDTRLRLVGRDTQDAGTSVLGEIIARAGALGVRAAIDVHEGWASSEEVIDHFASSTVAAVPSRWESFGYVAAEAASIGRAVVASDVPGLDDVVSDDESGIRVAAADVDGWARALISVVSDPGLAATLGERGAARMRQRNAPDVVALQTLEVYERAIRASRNRSTGPDRR